MLVITAVLISSTVSCWISFRSSALQINNKKKRPTQVWCSMCGKPQHCKLISSSHVSGVLAECSACYMARAEPGTPYKERIQIRAHVCMYKDVDLLVCFFWVRPNEMMKQIWKRVTLNISTFHQIKQWTGDRGMNTGLLFAVNTSTYKVQNAGKKNNLKRASNAFSHPFRARVCDMALSYYC